MDTIDVFVSMGQYGTVLGETGNVGYEVFTSGWCVFFLYIRRRLG